VTLNYSHTSGAQSWWSEAIELKAAAACGSPTTTPAPTTTPTATVSPSPDATPLPETVITASLTYSADDYFEFWINGNQVAAATVFDAGAPPVTVAVPAADFAPGGSPNFIAAEDLNSVANTVGCAWLLTTHNADGSTSYYSSADAGIALYDDTAGASPPPLNGGNNWYQAGWVDAGGLFNQTPVATTAIAWFLPLNLTNPSSGAPIPVLSSNASGLQHSLAEKLYFRESALLVPVTPTFTPGGPSKTASPSQTPFYTATPTPTQSPVFSPTPTPTVTPSPACCNDSDTPTVTPTVTPTSSPTNTPVPGSPSLTPSQSYTFTVTPTFTATLTFTAGGPTRSPSPTATFSPTPTGAVTPRSCGIPGLADARNLFKGCYGLANTVTYTVASRPDQLLLVRVENGSAGRPQAVLYGGVALTPFRTDPTYSGGSLSTFYLAGPPAGTAPLEIDYLSGGCSWNVVAELYSGVDQNSPLGAAGAATGTSNSFSTSLSTTGPESLVSDFMALFQASTSSVTLGGGQVDLGYSPQDGCCEEIFGDVKSVGRPGAHTLTYHLNKAKQYTDQLVEVKGWGACGSPTPTPPATLPPRADPPPGDIFTYPQPCRGRALHFAYFMRRPGQANLRIFNAAGVALGGLDEHREAGPEVGTLEVSAFANGVFYYQMEIRYDAGDREMLKVGKFLIVRP
ncbi:MAG TPA: hypothetical protein VNZ54_00815, partial [bacterium]|nr:hypothetical protein [bacterium]